MSEKSEIISLFMNTLDPQARFNMEVAVQIDELQRSAGGDDEATTDFRESVDEGLNLLAAKVSVLQNELKILRGALEETINQLRDLQKPSAERTVRETQEQARPGMTPRGHRSHAKKFRGVYCRNCATPLKGKHQTIFCSRKCAAQWKAQHPNQHATPRLAVKEGYDAAVVAGEGVRAGSVTA